jgi:hypothetical protein
MRVTTPLRIPVEFLKVHSGVKLCYLIILIFRRLSSGQRPRESHRKLVLSSRASECPQRSAAESSQPREKLASSTDTFMQDNWPYPAANHGCTRTSPGLAWVLDIAPAAKPLAAKFDAAMMAAHSLLFVQCCL